MSSTHRQPSHCRIWWARVTSASSVPVASLDPDETRRRTAYRIDADRDRFTVGVWLSRLVLGEALGVPAQRVPLRRDCADCGKPHGRPRLTVPGPHISISHSGEWITVAVADATPVGVDVQECDTASMVSLDAVLSPRELTGFRLLGPARRRAAFFTVWTRKEAVLKATGHGLRTPLADVEVTRPDRAAGVLAMADPPESGISLSDLPSPTGYSAALAVLDTRVPVVSHHDGDELLRTSASQNRDGATF